MTAPPPLRRNQTIELARCVAAFGVISIHCAPTTSAASHVVDFFQLFSVPFFLLTSLFFFWQEVGRTGDPARALRRRLPRLLVPYAAWSMIYAGAHCLKLAYLGRPPLEWLRPSSLLGIVATGGAAVQLYFLPLLAVALGLAWLLAILLRTAGQWRPGVLAALLMAGCAALFRHGDLVVATGTSPWAQVEVQYANWAVAMFPFAVVAALLASLPMSIGPSRKTVGWALLAAAAALDVATIAGGLPYAVRFQSLLLSALALEGCRRLDLGPAAARRLAPLLATSFGIYLAHHLFVEFVELIDRRPVGTFTQPFTLASLLLVGAAVFAASAAFTLGVLKRRRIAYVLLGR